MHPKNPHAHPRAKKSREQENTAKRTLLDLGKSLLLTVGTGLCLLLALSAALACLPDPLPLIPLAGLAASALTALLGGLFAVRIHGHGALLCGLSNGCGMLLLMLPLSLLLRTEASGYSAPVACLLHAGFLLLSVAGAFLGLARGDRAKAQRRSAHARKKRRA